MEKEFSIGKVSFSEEMPEESKLWLERLVERIILKELDLDPSVEAKLISHSTKH
ncbi:hypothetical protein SAMN05216232_0361 [Virgibacillus subterraneus]|uniref:Sporulation histidine kinase inhibitor Sda n=1 Tax=Virgibacillus subterraneus TaxID=621109 RepID=A0A1H8ZB23_9BACI|nr:hypothetical protein [Virgibacillus subterraneus]SEP61612.1 hypothetical protein SAMN05216232_0361 [Virgibacillus subterraneus]